MADLEHSHAELRRRCADRLLTSGLDTALETKDREIAELRTRLERAQQNGKQ
jgi:hypothetical protein